VAFSWYENALPVFALPESRVKQPADLKGCRIAAIETKGQSFDYDRMVYLRPFASALATVGLALKDVREVKSVVEREMIHDAAPTAKNFTQQMAELFLRQLLRGEVDAIATSLPPEVVRFFDLVTVYDGRKDPDINARVDLRALVVSGSVLREHRAALVAIVAALMRTGSWALENTPEVVPLIAKDVSIDDKMLRARGIDFVRGSQIDASDAFVEIMRKRKDFLLAAGLLEKDFDIEQWVDRSIVRDAKALLHAKVG
jgi:ABC-type nitrate/sulfonate/bicarbonate transport system substrate-binding protein